MKFSITTVSLSLTTLAVLGAIMLNSPNNTATAAASNQSDDISLPRVTIVQPEPVNSAQPYQFNARLEAIESAHVFARADGYIENRLVDIGDEVSQGQLLAQLSSPELEEQIRQAKAEINRQQAVVHLSKKMSDRVSRLQGSGAVTQTEVDEKDAEYQVALATLETYQARLEQLENEFAYTRIVAPFDGIITVRNVDRGDRITRNDSQALFRIVRTDELRVLVDIPQTQLYSIDQNQQATLLIPELASQSFEVNFSRMSREIDNTLGTMRLEYLLDNADQQLSAGLSGRLRIPASTTDRLQIPINAVKILNGESVVMTVDQEDRLQQRPVVTGRYNSHRVEIRNGLSTQDRVVLNPNALLKTGDRVAINE